MSAADKIRNYAYKHFIRPAKERGDISVKISARDVHEGLSMTSQFPNVCQALSGKKFYLKYHLSIPEVIGPNPSSTTHFIYKL